MQRANRVSFLILGACLFAYGCGALFARSHWSSRFGTMIDLGPYHFIVGVLLMVLGGYIVGTSLRSILLSRKK